MGRLLTSRYRARTAGNADDIHRARELRYRCFVEGTGAAERLSRTEADAFDDRCTHTLIEDTATGALVGCFRVLHVESGQDIDRSYSAQYYDLDRLSHYPGPMLEVGRFCTRPGLRDPDILRIAWMSLTRMVESGDTRLLFGCSSFAGTVPETYLDAFALLRARHLAPSRWMPQRKAPEVCRFDRIDLPLPDPLRALKTMPSLLRGYLSMEGWVSDHAVIDRDLGTMHVFTGLEVANVPSARVRLLRETAA